MISSADRWFLVGEVLLGVGIGFVDRRHFDCGSVVMREEEIGGTRVYTWSEIDSWMYSRL